MKVNGFAVTRLPSENYFDGDESRPVGNFHGIYYGGYFREKWLELDHGYWRNHLPEEVWEHYLPLYDKWQGEIGLHLSSDLEACKVLLTFSNKEKLRNEIMAVATDLYEEPKIEVSADKLILRGYDVIGEHGGARIDLGLFFKPQLFEPFINAINFYGLFDSKEICQSYIDFYRNIVKLTKGTEIEDCGAYDEDNIKPAMIFSVK